MCIYFFQGSQLHADFVGVPQSCGLGQVRRVHPAGHRRGETVRLLRGRLPSGARGQRSDLFPLHLMGGWPHPQAGVGSAFCLSPPKHVAAAPVLQFLVQPVYAELVRLLFFSNGLLCCRNGPLPQWSHGRDEAAAQGETLLRRPQKSGGSSREVKSLLK